MRGALIRAAFLLALAIVASADDRPPDISGESETAYHKYVDRPVVVRGRFSLRGKFGPFIDTGKVVVYLKPENPPDFDSTMEGQRGIVVGTLRYQSAKPSKDPSVAGVPSFFYLGGDCAFLKPGVL
jgi:hypothetical protein